MFPGQSNLARVRISLLSIFFGRRYFCQPARTLLTYNIWPALRIAFQSPTKHSVFTLGMLGYPASKKLMPLSSQIGKQRNHRQKITRTFCHVSPPANTTVPDHEASGLKSPAASSELRALGVKSEFINLAKWTTPSDVPHPLLRHS